MANFNCTACDRAFATKASLNSHKYRYHKNNSSTIAVLDPSSKEDEQKLITEIMNLSDSDSDSDDSIFPDDETNPITNNKRNRTPDSSDEEPAPKVQRKRNISTDLSDDEGSVVTPVIRKKKLVKKRKRVSDSSDDEPTPKVHRKRHISTDSSDNGDSDVDQQLFNTKWKLKRRRKFSTKKIGQSESGINKNKIKKLQKLETELLEKKVDIIEDRYALDCSTMDDDIRTKDKTIASQTEEIEYLKDLLKKEVKRAKLYIDQLRSDENPQPSPIENILDNRVSIKQINSIRHLLISGHLQPIVDDDEMVETIQHLFMGLREGVIPIANAQKLAFTPEHDSYMNDLPEMTIADAGDYIAANPNYLVEIFDIVDQSLKLMCKTYMKFVGSFYADDDEVNSNEE